MTARPWYKRNPADFIGGTMGLSLEEKGAYSLCLDLIYMHDGPIPDDARWLAGVCNVSVRRWSAIRAGLIAAGKITVAEGRISNSRAIFELEISAKTSRNLAENGARGGNKKAENAAGTSKNNDIPLAESKQAKPLDKIREEKKEDYATAHASPPDPQALLATLFADAGDALDPTAPATMASTELRKWLAAGCDFEADIRPAIRATAARLRAEGRSPVRSWRFFEGAVADAKAARLRPMPEGRSATGPPVYAGKRLAVVDFLERLENGTKQGNSGIDQPDDARLAPDEIAGAAGVPSYARRLRQGG